MVSGTHVSSISFCPHVALFSKSPYGPRWLLQLQPQKPHSWGQEGATKQVTLSSPHGHYICQLYLSSGTTSRWKNDLDIKSLFWATMITGDMWVSENVCACLCLCRCVRLRTSLTGKGEWCKSHAKIHKKFICKWTKDSAKLRNYSRADIYILVSYI